MPKWLDRIRGVKPGDDRLARERASIPDAPAGTTRARAAATSGPGVGPASASPAVPAVDPVLTAPAVAVAVDPVAQAAAEEAAAKGEDDGRGHRPASVGLMWTDSLGRVATRSLQTLLVIALVALLIWGGLQLTIVIIPVLLAMIIASAASPVLTRLRTWGWPSALATVVVMLAVVIVFGGAITLVVLMVEHEWETLSANVADGFTALLAWIETTFGLVVDGAQLQQWVEQVRDFVFSNQGGSAAASGVTAGVSAVASFLTSTVLFLVVLFFFMKDGPVIWRFLLKPVRDASRRRFELMGQRAVGVMGGYVRGTVIVALVDAVFIGIGLWAIGVPLAFPLAVVVFITAFIPVVGATLAGIVAALVTVVTNGLWEAVIVVIIVVVVNQLEGNFLQPVVLGRSLKLHALVVLIALTVGTVLGGIIGTLLAVPITAVGWALIKAWNEPLPKLEKQAEQGSFGRDPDEPAVTRPAWAKFPGGRRAAEGADATLGAGTAGNVSR